jgi:hypothetical protein
LSYLAWPIKPIIYTGFYYWQEHGSKDAQWADHPLWIAQYKIDKPTIPAPWKSYIFWQFAETGPGRVLGAESNAIDLDYFNGTLEQLQKFAGKPVEVPQPVPMTELVIHGKQTITVTYADADGNQKVESKDVEF